MPRPEFIGYFSWSNIGTVLAINGAETLERWDLPVFVLFGGVVLLVALLVSWFLSFMLWYAIGLPLGPGVPIR